jgi:heme-binding protein
VHGSRLERPQALVRRAQFPRERLRLRTRCRCGCASPRSPHGRPGVDVVTAAERPDAVDPRRATEAGPRPAPVAEVGGSDCRRNRGAGRARAVRALRALAQESPVQAESNWDSAQTRTLAKSACFDCHSNETRWPWYSSVPVVSWLIEHDVSEGRAQLNFSTWHDYTTFERADLLDKVCEKAAKREMPLWQYRLLHPDSRLDPSAVAAICEWSRREAARLVGAGS